VRVGGAVRPDLDLQLVAPFVNVRTDGEVSLHETSAHLVLTAAETVVEGTDGERRSVEAPAAEDTGLRFRLEDGELVWARPDEGSG
jgi:hypothetical protein